MPPTQNQNQSLEWQAPEYDHFVRDARWFWQVGLGAVVLILLAILVKNFLLAVIILLAGFTVMLYGARPPALLHFSLTPKGLRVNRQLYPFRRLHSFWVSDEFGKRKIIMESERWFLPHLIIPLPEDVSDDEARQFLLKHLPEEHHEESAADYLADYLGF